MLKNYAMAPAGTSNGIASFDWTLPAGEAVAVDTDTMDDARLLLRGLATLVPPLSGHYRFCGQTLDFSDYRKLLPYKKKIGYAGPDAGVLNNRSLLENLLFMRYYAENASELTLDKQTDSLCRSLGLHGDLARRPTEMSPQDLQTVVMLRELSKSPSLLLLDRPEDIADRNRLAILTEQVRDSVAAGTALVLLSFDPDMIRRLTRRPLRIRKGQVSV